MKKILNLVVQDRSDPKNPVEFIESFKLRGGIQQPEQALRSAVSEFINSGTVEAQEALNYANGCFNWGDAMRAVPRGLFIKHGLTPLNKDSIDIFVEHNEILGENIGDSK